MPKPELLEALAGAKEGELPTTLRGAGGRNVWQVAFRHVPYLRGAAGSPVVYPEFPILNGPMHRWFGGHGGSQMYGYLRPRGGVSNSLKHSLYICVMMEFQPPELYGIPRPPTTTEPSDHRPTGPRQPPPPADPARRPPNETSHTFSHEPRPGPRTRCLTRGAIYGTVTIGPPGPPAPAGQPTGLPRRPKRRHTMIRDHFHASRLPWIIRRLHDPVRDASFGVEPDFDDEPLPRPDHLGYFQTEETI